MPVYQFVIKTQNREGQPIQFPKGTVLRFVIAHPSRDVQQVQQWCRQYNLGTQPFGYSTFRIADKEPYVLAQERLADPHISTQAVQAGQQPPRGQLGQDRPAGEYDGSGFEDLPDMAMDTMGEPGPYGEVHDGTVSDIILEGGGTIEVERPQPQPQQRR